MKEFITLVDENDQVLGPIEKLEAHKKGVLHRAFSVFIFNSKGEILLQQRADEKYHSAGLWSNACCSHPNYQEAILDAVKRRMKEELSMDVEVEFKFKFTYKASLENNLVEHEVDHVYFGITDEIPEINPKEVKDWKYMSLDALKKELTTHPENYSQWLNICFPKVLSSLKGA